MFCKDTARSFDVRLIQDDTTVHLHSWYVIHFV